MALMRQPCWVWIASDPRDAASRAEAVEGFGLLGWWAHTTLSGEGSASCRAGTYVVKNALELLRDRFSQMGGTEGYRKDGPVAVAKFELGESDEPEQREARALRQREVSDLIEQLLARIG